MANQAVRFLTRDHDALCVTCCSAKPIMSVPQGVTIRDRAYKTEGRGGGGASEALSLQKKKGGGESISLADGGGGIKDAGVDLVVLAIGGRKKCPPFERVRGEGVKSFTLS